MVFINLIRIGQEWQIDVHLSVGEAIDQADIGPFYHIPNKYQVANLLDVIARFCVVYKDCIFSIIQR